MQRAKPSGDGPPFSCLRIAHRESDENGGGESGYRPALQIKRKRLTNCTVDGVVGSRQLVPDSPSAGREFSDSIDRKISQTREHGS
jgi:hypothetical protein